MRLGINARFLGAPVTGVQRFAREIMARLATSDEVTLFLPRGIDAGPTQARVVEGRSAAHLWEQIELPHLARRAGTSVLLHLANASPVWGGPHVQVLHDVSPWTHPHYFSRSYRAWARLAHLASARRADALITVSHHSASQIAHVAGVAEERIEVVRQGLGPIDSPAEQEAVLAVRERFGVSGPYFLAVGVGDARKGFDFAAQAFQAWCDSVRPSGPVTLVGVGSQHRMVHAGAVPDAEAVYTGRVDDEVLRALYTGATALMFPSTEEGFGRPPLEAMACGARVLVAPYATAHEFLENGADIVPREVDAWVRALDAVMSESADTRAARVQRGREVAAGFSWDAAADRIRMICEGVSATTARAGAGP